MAFFKQENLLNIERHFQKILYISRFLKNITLLPAEKFGNIILNQETVLLKMIYDFRIEFSFMEKYKFLIPKKLRSNMYFQLQ